MKPAISVLLCSHNGTPAYLERVLEALRGQTLTLDAWELLVIDNASREPLADRYDLKWHPRARHLREERVGKFNALMLGFREAAGDIHVIVDDDNVLARDYLEKVRAIAEANPRLGAWGGNVVLQFEEPPPEWTRGYWPFLAEQTVLQDTVHGAEEAMGPLPVGAGCCVRREVSEYYSAQAQGSAQRRTLGRTGTSLMSGEDTDLVLTARDLGLSCGLFADLRLEHLIPPRRLTEEYLLRLVEGVQFSTYVMLMSRDPKNLPPVIDWKWKLGFYGACALRFGRKRRFYIVNKRAQRQARELYESVRREP